MRSSLARALYQLTLTLLCLAFASASAWAQAPEPPKPIRVVVMTVPGGGTKILAETLATIPNTILYPERWFATQAKERGFSSPGVLDKPKDLTWLMARADLDLIVRVERQRKSLKASLIVADAKIARTIDVPNDRDGLTQEGADMIAGAMEDVLRARFAQFDAAPTPPPDTPPQTTPDPDPIVARDEPVIVDDSPKRGRDAKRGEPVGASIGGGLRLLKRDLAVTSPNAALINYTSSFYPGYELTALVYPGKEVPVGLMLGFIHGFDSVTLQSAEGESQVFPLRHLQLEGGASYTLLKPKRGQREATVSLHAMLRWASYALDENDVMPSISQLAFLFGAQLLYPMSDKLALRGRLDVMPYNGWLTGREQLGESVTSYGAGLMLGAQYAAMDNLDVFAGYTFQVMRSSFSGVGLANFVDASAFELIQGLQLGVSYGF